MGKSFPIADKEEMRTLIQTLCYKKLKLVWKWW